MGDYTRLLAVKAARLLGFRLGAFFDGSGRSTGETSWYPDFDEMFGAAARAPGGGIPVTLGDMLDEGSLLAALGGNLGLQRLLVAMLDVAGPLAGAVVIDLEEKEPSFEDVIDLLPPGPREWLAPFRVDALAVVAGEAAVAGLAGAVEALAARVAGGTLELDDAAMLPARGMVCIEDVTGELLAFLAEARRTGADIVAFRGM